MEDTVKNMSQEVDSSNQSNISLQNDVATLQAQLQALQDANAERAEESKAAVSALRIEVSMPVQLSDLGVECRANMCTALEHLSSPRFRS